MYRVKAELEGCVYGSTINHSGHCLLKKVFCTEEQQVCHSVSQLRSFCSQVLAAERFGAKWNIGLCSTYLELGGRGTFMKPPCDLPLGLLLPVGHFLLQTPVESLKTRVHGTGGTCLVCRATCGGKSYGRSAGIW